MCHPSKESLHSKTIATMLTTAIFALISKPIIWFLRKTICFKCLDQRIVIIDTSVRNCEEEDLPHGSTNDLTYSRNENVGRFSNSSIVGIRLHIKCLNRTRKVSEDDWLSNRINHESFGSYRLATSHGNWNTFFDIHSENMRLAFLVENRGIMLR